jgi:queuine tRNA-ribosyltransferase
VPKFNLSKNKNLFLPDATRGFIKLSDVNEIMETGTEALMVNTFHLYLQPKIQIIKKAGGIHKFIAWPNPIMSDSGGFQIFSLIHQNKKMGKISDLEVEFKSPLDGSWHQFSPEKSIQIQFDLGSDLIVCLDDCPANNASKPIIESAVKRTVAWAKRSKIEYEKQLKIRKIKDNDRPLILAVVQGALDIKLREQCASALVEIGFDAYGLGARPVDENGNFLTEVLKKTAMAIPKDKWRFALGVGMPEDIYRAFLLGWDSFDCVIPSREGRHGRLFYFKEDFKGFKGKNDNLDFYQTVNIKNASLNLDFSAINQTSQIDLLTKYSKSFLHHLFRLNDPLGQRLASLNNLEFFQKLIKYLKNIK